MGEQGDTDVCRISVFSDGVKKPTNKLVFTFNTPILPSVVKIGLMQVKADVRVYTKPTGADVRVYTKSTLLLSMSSVWPSRKQVWQTGYMRQLQYA